MSWFTAIFMTVITLIISVPAAQASDEVSFSNWSATCDSIGFCRAINGDSARLIIQRHQRGQHWEVLLETPFEDDTSGVTLSFRIGVWRADFSGVKEVNSYGKSGDFYVMSNKAHELLSAMIAGATVSVLPVIGIEAPSVIDFSLAGLSASLLWIDERQNRVGELRIAGEPPYGLLPFGPQIDRSIFVPHALVQHHRADGGCSPFEELASGRDSIVASLGNALSIAVLPCWDGAYDFGSSVYVLEGQHYRPIFFAEYSDTDSWFVSKHLANVHFDHKARTLSSFSRSRGLGDCGSTGFWRWARNEFRLETYRHKEECDGTVDPSRFPLVFSAKPYQPADSSIDP